MRALRILNDCCGTRPNITQVMGNEISVDIPTEPMTRADWATHDYNVHFCLGLENFGDEACTVDVGVNGGRFNQLPQIAPLLYASALPDKGFEPFTVQARTDLGKRYAMYLTLQPGERIYLANTLVRSLPLLQRRFDALAENGGAIRHVFGHSVQGRELVAYTYGDPTERGCILVSSGFHPPEPDTLATEAIMEWLGSTEGMGLVTQVAIVVIPLANPDGYALGTQGANAEGINFYWHFAFDMPDRCPEAAALWRLADSLAPRGYIDFHSYTFQLNKEAGPYVRPLQFHASVQARHAAKAFYDALADRLHTKPVLGFSTYAPHTLGSMLADKYDTVTAAKYHLHLKQGAKACGIHGLRVFQLLAEALLTEKMTGRATPRSRRALDLVCWTRRVWAGFLRPQLGLLRRGRLAELRFDRTGRDMPILKN
jgi:hypothetical protein